MVVARVEGYENRERKNNSNFPSYGDATVNVRNNNNDVPPPGPTAAETEFYT